MAERANKAAAASAFAASRELVEGVARRIDVLGPGTQGLIDALVERLDALPFAAHFDPFAAVPAAPAESRRESSAARSNGKRRAPGSGTTTQPSPSPFGALGQAVAGALGSLATEPPQVMSLEAALAGAPFLKSTGSPDAPTPSTAARRAAGKSTATRAATPEGGLLAAPVQAADLVAQWLSQWVGGAAAGAKPAGSQAAAGGALGAAIAGQSLFPQQFLDALAALDPNPAHARRAAPAAGSARKTSTAGRDETLPRRGDPAPAATPESPPSDFAPRADSRLLPPAAAARRTAAEQATPLEPGRDADDPIDAMTRALIDQAWLRGVDLR